MATRRAAGRGGVVLSGTVVGLVAAVLAACGTPAGGTGVPVVPPSTAPSPTATDAPAGGPSTGAPAPTADAERAVPIYYVTDTPAGPRLAREFRRLPVGDEPAAAGSAAVTALLDADGAVPGHRSTWPAGTGLRAPVTHADGVVTVDLTADAGHGTPADPALAVQQLVYTVTGALGTADPVRLLVDGASVPRLWNDGVVTGQPIARADPLGIRVLVGIDEPAPGARTTSPVQVAGEAAVFEATLRWEVRRGDTVVRSGTASTSEGQKFAPYSFSVALPPGEYEVRVSEDDPSDGAGRAVMTDTHRVTVTG